MDYNRQIAGLFGETLAIQRFLVELCAELSLINPDFENRIRAAFDNTASYLEDRTIEFGDASPPEHLAGALRIIETIRAAALGRPDKPQHGV